MSADNNTPQVPGMFIRGGTTTRQENMDTELWLPAAQALLRAGVDCLAILLALTALVIGGRYVIWILVAGVLFSDRYDMIVDHIVARFTGPVAWMLDRTLFIFRWGWIIGGGLLALNILVPITWTTDGYLWLQNAVLAPAWPFLFWRAPWIEIPFGGFMRLIALILCVVPLASWAPLRDRMTWAIWEFTPFGPVNVAESGIDPHNWKPRIEPAPVANPVGAGVNIHSIDEEPNETEIATGVWVSNGGGGHHKHHYTSWVTTEQWRELARRVLILKQPFTEDNFAKGKVFPTHGPKDSYGNQLGFRLLKQTFLEAGYIVHKGNHPNEGFEWTDKGLGELRKWLVEV